MRVRAIAVTLITTAALVLSGCGGDDDADAVLTVSGKEPQNPLVPSSTNEAGGGKIVDQLWAGLVAYKSDGSVIPEVAESIESQDNKTWTVKLKDNWTFTDGTPVQAHNFVDAWNYGALSSNNQLNSYFYYPIKGFFDLQQEKPQQKNKKNNQSKKMSGLKIVNDYEFTITLNQAESRFPQRLGYSAFYPLPDSAFDDMKEFGEHPVGNGPYKMAGKDAWVHDKKISLVPNNDYRGHRKPQNDGLTFKFYSDPDEAYADVRDGSLDILDEVPDSQLPDYQSDDDVQAFGKPGSVFESITVPGSVKHFGFDKEGTLRRRALSMALDREQMTSKVFGSSRTPARDFTSPLMPGFSDELDGADVLNHNAQKAKKLWAKADKIDKWSGKFTIAFVDGSDHQEWIEAAAKQLHKTLGIKAAGKKYDSDSNLREDITATNMKSAFRSGWQPDYPSMFNYLQPRFQSGADSNNSGYDNKKFDAALKKSAGADDADTEYRLVNDAQEILLQDLPVIPLSCRNISAAAATDIEDVSFNWQNEPEYYRAHK